MGKIILGAFILDGLLGDPRRRTHPIVLIGGAISWMENQLRRFFSTSQGLKYGGIALWWIIVGGAYLVTDRLISLAYYIHPWLGTLVALWLTYTTLAVKDLAQEAQNIYGAIDQGNLEKARWYLARIVGRDVENLWEKDLIRATIETVAENTIDGVVTPLFYAFLGGPGLAMAYKAANTLDSMVGNKSPQYLHLGWWSAKADDLLNYLPARLGGLVMVVASAGLGLDYTGAIATARRDAKKHVSPNSGIPEAITAGALGVRLGGYNFYSGIEEFRAYMGKKTRGMVAEDILKTVKLSISTSVLTLFFAELIYWLLA